MASLISKMKGWVSNSAGAEADAQAAVKALKRREQERERSSLQWLLSAGKLPWYVDQKKVRAHRRTRRERKRRTKPMRRVRLARGQNPRTGAPA
jgi:hypothetical protein